MNPFELEAKSPIATINLACVGCQYIENNIVNWKKNLNVQSLTIKKHPVPGVDDTALAVFIDDERVGFIPKDDKLAVLEFANKYRNSWTKKSVIITKVQALPNSDNVTWFSFTIEIKQ